MFPDELLYEFPNEAEECEEHMWAHYDELTPEQKAILEPVRGHDRAISIRQPYAELILRWKKRWEYRSRPTRIRGRVWIYAPLKFDGDDRLPRGVIVGSVVITGCERNESLRCWAYRLADPQRCEPWKPDGQPQPCFWYASPAEERKS